MEKDSHALQEHPRARLAFLPTPVVRLPKLTQSLGGPHLWMKRDDQTGLAFGGNKTRKLEFLVGEALAQGCDTLLSAGAAQSNQCRQVAAAAAAVGFDCHLALGGEPPRDIKGNVLLDLLFGATLHWCGDQRKGEALPRIAETLLSRGKKPYVIPYGGSNAVGALGYVSAMEECVAQQRDLGIEFDAIFVASSSGGTLAGMYAGAKMFGYKGRIIGIAIDKTAQSTAAHETMLAELATETAARAGLPIRFSADSFELLRGYLGDGYGVVGTRERKTILRVARSEGILLDPVYTGKAMGGLIDLIEHGELGGMQNVMFWHTGGTPALFADPASLFEGGP